MTSDTPKTVTLTVGTAGHIDHGKTEIVKYLTGCVTDVLPEEQARGMTINIGFATCELPNHRRVGIVDVPGHERFIHNMVAGAAGVDVVLLVVAADDGVMPQTIEHFHIVRMLGVSSGMIVINKTDLVDKERIPEVEAQVRALTNNSMLEGCPIVPFSAKTGDNFNEFHSTFVSVVDKTAEHNSEGPFRLHVERAFIMQGRGTIISGIPCSGKVNLGDELTLLPEGKKTTVRGVQVYGQDAKEALTGECAALKMSDIGKSNPTRGMVLAKPGFFTPSQLINAKFQHLPHLTKTLKPRTAVRFHIGTTDVPGHMILPELKDLKPGEETYVQFQLKSPVVAAPGDFYVARLLSPATTVGGGYVVSPVDQKIRRSNKNWADECVEREEAFKNPETAIRYAINKSAPEPMEVQQIAHRSFMNEEAAAKYLAALLEEGEVIEFPGKKFIASKHVMFYAKKIEQALNRLHDKTPLSTGFPTKDVIPHVNAHRLIFDKSLATLIEEGKVVSSDTGLALKDRGPTLKPKQAELADKITTLYKDAAFSTPRRDELSDLLGMPEPLIKPVIDYLFQTGTIVAVDDLILFHSDHVEDAKAMVTDYINTNGSVEAAAVREMLNTSRKYVIPLLEYFDKIKLTVRKGNARTLSKR
ncbi:selenocysteine-specific translation elongation factor [bacterium E08(2017)]|nr:selenocysteine-specific translation elongation factor [bacterium E08(2017)]